MKLFKLVGKIVFNWIALIFMLPLFIVGVLVNLIETGFRAGYRFCDEYLD